MRYKLNLSSELKNRIGLWSKEKVPSGLGNTLEDKEIKKLWAKIIPFGGSLKKGAGETQFSDTNYKIKIRKSKRIITQNNWIIYQHQKYEIKYIVPDYKNNCYTDLYCNLIIE